MSPRTHKHGFRLRALVSSVVALAQRQWSQEVSTKQKSAAAIRQGMQNPKEDTNLEELNGEILRTVVWSCTQNA